MVSHPYREEVAERCARARRHPSSWIVRQAEVAEVVHRQHPEVAGAEHLEDDSCLSEAVAANLGRELGLLVQAAQARWADAWRSWAVTRSEELALPYLKAVAEVEVLRPSQEEAAEAYLYRAEAVEAVHQSCAAVEEVHRQRLTSSEAAHRHRGAAEASHRTAEAAAGLEAHLEAPSSAVEVHLERPLVVAVVAPCPSWVAAHLEGPSSVAERQAFRPSSSEAVLVEPAERQAFRPSSSEAVLVEPAERQASPCHPSSEAEPAERQASPCHPSSEAQRKVQHHRTSAASGLALEVADIPEVAAKAAEQACPQSKAESAAQIPAHLPRYAAHQGTACAGCSCAAEHIASSTR